VGLIGPTVPSRRPYRPAYEDCSRNVISVFYVCTYHH